MQENPLHIVDDLVATLGKGEAQTIALLQAIQNHFGYLPAEAMRRLCEITTITPARLEAVSTFYSQFRHSPAGEHTIAVCHGTACHVKGAPGVMEAIRRHLNIPEGEDTDAKGKFTVEKIACLGCCTLAPAVKIDEITYGHLTPETVDEMIEDFLSQSKHKPAKPRHPVTDPDGEILLGLGSCCVSRGSGRVKEVVEDTLAQTEAQAVVKRVGCVGMCHQTPLMEIVERDGTRHHYANVDPADARRIVRKHFAPRGWLNKSKAIVRQALEAVLTDESWSGVERYRVTPRDPQIESFLSPQRHIATEDYGQLDPLSLEEYREREGFVAFEAVVRDSSSESVLAAVLASGLRGRGGAGFETGRKWRLVHDAPAKKKYVVCNGDEGDPGAFMDRMLLESFPYRVLEGLMIAARTVGANEGVLYIRAEYPLALERMKHAIAECERVGLLGEDVLGTGQPLSLRIMEGAGAFVCGEETALLASIEGRRGMPKLRPPYPATRGLWNKPTLVNNVETLSCVPWILRHGPEAFAEIGSTESRGTKVFALAGKIHRGGLIEVPMGITIREIVDHIGGGVPDGKALKAVQVGGPSGGCVPASLIDTPVDYHALQDVGAIMGSGGLVVLDEDDCMVDIARYFLEFTQDESCGKCTFCRVGTRRMLEILERLCAGEAKEGDLDLLEHLAIQVQRGSLCGLGKTAPNPILSTLRHFRDEYEAHLAGRCPAGVCRAMITYSISDECIGCTKCAQDCPVGAIDPKPLERNVIQIDKCIRCGACKTICPVGAVKVS